MSTHRRLTTVFNRCSLTAHEGHSVCNMSIRPHLRATLYTEKDNDITHPPTHTHTHTHTHTFESADLYSKFLISSNVDTKSFKCGEDCISEQQQTLSNDKENVLSDKPSLLVYADPLSADVTL